MPALGTRITLFLCAALLALGAAACGGDSDAGTGSAAEPAPSAGEFPSAEGRTLQEIASEGTGEGPVVSFAGKVFYSDQANRIGFGVFTVDRTQIEDAEIAIYAAPGPDLTGQAVGPFPARIEDLSTKAPFVAQTTSADPDAAQVVYVADLELPEPGNWSFLALMREGDGYTTSLIPAPAKVDELKGQIPRVGDKAPVVSTPTADDVPDIGQIDTRVPPGTLHDEDLKDVLGKKPVVLLFATPALCVSRVCGPVVDVAEQVKAEGGHDGVAFIHQEIYNDNDPGKGVRSQVSAYGLPSEPWLFVIDRDGRVSTAIEGAFSVQELEDALAKVE